MKNNTIKIIAEIGWNHMGDMSLAEQMIKSAATNGANICKFQSWSESRLKSGPWDLDGRREIYKKAELNKEKHLFLMETCKKNNVEFLTSVFNEHDLNFLIDLKIDKIKIPSHEIHNIKLIQQTIENFNTVFISTGASKWSEITEISKKVSTSGVIFMHCVSTYPCPINSTNLPRLAELKKLFNTVGYSGHYDGVNDAIAAICFGAVYIEKHFTVDKDLPGRDNKFAILPQDLKTLSIFRNNYEQMSKNKGLDLQDCELDIYNNYRGRWSGYEK